MTGTACFAVLTVREREKDAIANLRSCNFFAGLDNTSCSFMTNCTWVETGQLATGDEQVGTASVLFNYKPFDRTVYLPLTDKVRKRQLCKSCVSSSYSMNR